MARRRLRAPEMGLFLLVGLVDFPDRQVLGELLEPGIIIESSYGLGGVLVALAVDAHLMLSR
jgi:hypothetical protein